MECFCFIWRSGGAGSGGKPDKAGANYEEE
jgi:hypothetical protein